MLLLMATPVNFFLYLAIGLAMRKRRACSLKRGDLNIADATDLKATSAALASLRVLKQAEYLAFTRRN